MVEKKFRISMLSDGLKRTNSTSIFSNYLHHGWRKFWISMHWNGLEWTNSTPIFSKYLHHGWRKVWISVLWNGLERTNSAPGDSPQKKNMFTMVEENFEFQCFEMA